MKTLLIALVSISLISCFHPKKAKHDVPVTYHVDWWAKNANLTIQQFDVKVEEANLNLLNNQAKLSYTISGSMKSNAGWKPYIETAHISERVIPCDTLQNCVEITITPVMNTVKKKKYPGGEKAFSFTNEHIVRAIRWGQNRFVIRCGNDTKTIELYQKK